MSAATQATEPMEMNQISPEVSAKEAYMWMERKHFNLSVLSHVPKVKAL